MSLEVVIIVGLTVWRISSLLVREDGPYDVLAKVRHTAGVRYDEYSRAIGQNVIAKALTCVWCISIWVAGGAALFISDNVVNFLVNTLSMSAIAIIVNSFVDNPHGGA